MENIDNWIIKVTSFENETDLVDEVLGSVLSADEVEKIYFRFLGESGEMSDLCLKIMCILMFSGNANFYDLHHVFDHVSLEMSANKERDSFVGFVKNLGDEIFRRCGKMRSDFFRKNVSMWGFQIN